MQTTKKAAKAAKQSKQSSKQTKAVAAKNSTPRNPLTPQQQAQAKKVLAKLKANPATNGVGKIAAIMQLYTHGFNQAQIVQLGYNRSTVYRQTGVLNKLRNLKNKKLITGNGVVALTAKAL